MAVRVKCRWRIATSFAQMFGDKPFSLTRWFAAVGLVSIAAISAVSGVLLSRFLTERMLQQEGRLFQQFVDSVARIEKVGDYFANGRTGPARELKEFFTQVSELPDVLRANLYARDRTIIWSSDTALVGRQFRDNPELEEALHGRLVVHGGERGKLEHSDLYQQHRYFVEIYAPVVDASRGGVIGVVEIYRTPLPLFEAINAGHRAIWIGAALAGIFLYVALFWMVKRADNLIRVQRERLIQAETLAVVGEMGSAVAHGIRNPLASIRSSAELALESEPSQWREAAHDIVEEVDRLESWVRELLAYSQPLAGKLEPIHVGQLVEVSLQGFKRELERRGIQATARVGEPLPPVAADPLMLGQVFNSLIANAVEAVERNGRIALSVQRDGERRLRVSIQDSGPGMSRDQLAGAFKPFHTTKAKGIGLGLPLAKRIVERFGGSIALASEPGKGTTIDVLLPAA